MNESASEEDPTTFLSVSMGPVKGTDDTQRLISTFFYTSRSKEREEFKEWYSWKLVKEIGFEETKNEKVIVEIEKGLKWHDMVGREEKVRFELAFSLMKYLEYT